MKIILADSNELIRVGLRTILHSETAIEIIGEARDGDELKELVLNFGADVILIDYTSPGFSIDIIPKVLSVLPTIKFVAILIWLMRPWDPRSLGVCRIIPRRPVCKCQLRSSCASLKTLLVV